MDEKEINALRCLGCGTKVSEFEEDNCPYCSGKKLRELPRELKCCN